MSYRKYGRTAGLGQTPKVVSNLEELLKIKAAMAADLKKAKTAKEKAEIEGALKAIEEQILAWSPATGKAQVQLVTRKEVQALVRPGFQSLITPGTKFGPKLPPKKTETKKTTTKWPVWVWPAIIGGSLVVIGGAYFKYARWQA